ncbi:MAG TPA: tetratricopeptide repeat protein, partial [Nitrospirota bacterium]|nr:tetratricopeptide repeat protein [Nitrospirota bacterium]
KEADAFFGLGVAYLHLGDLPTARWAFTQALELKPENKEAQQFIVTIDQTRSSKQPASPQSRFRAEKDYLEIHDGTWKQFFIKGVNIGLGLPGYFPGEFGIKQGTYRKWFHDIANLGANAVRVYTILPPDFYEALHQFNQSGTRLYLFQGIWTELPEDNDFDNDQFEEGLFAVMKDAVDAIYGNTVLPEQPGRPHGNFTYDVSPYVAGFIIGREWESCAVKGYNDRRERMMADYLGSFLRIENGTPFEVWITKICDYLQRYEDEKYHCSHPVTTVNWPTLDPIDHPSESSHEEEYRLQGKLPQGYRGPCIDTNIEDEETLDLAKITPIKGNGFFALYHAYPYYPDFMNNDYLDQENPYLAYLSALKKHHGRQPVVIAEFGVPSSRESSHWHRIGWHHGGHGDREQGEINAILMKSVHQAGMAGGVLFSWFDEWFKRNWLFRDAELPADRKPLWFNAQDPEENYGLLAAYPGYPEKKVHLTCRGEDWQETPALYEKNDDSMAFRFYDGSDEARRLVRLSAQHDEGYFYLLLETAGKIDFTTANILVGLDTAVAGVGERLFPFELNLKSPVGLTFLLQLCGKENSRILVSAAYDKYLNDQTGLIRPQESDQGAWVMMQNLTNNRRISKDGKQFFPAHVFTMSRLRYGSLDVKSRDYHSLADFFLLDNKIELRIPWGLINVTDPSSKMVLWKDKDVATRKTAGIRALAISYRPEKGKFVPHQTGRTSNYTDSLPAILAQEHIKTYSWDEWNTPIYHTYLKESYYRYQKVLQTIPEAP